MNSSENPTTLPTAAIAAASVPPLERATFIDPRSPADIQARHHWLLRLLLAQDGSTTRLCQTIAGAPLSLQVRRQSVITDIDARVREFLPGQRFIHRVTSLAARGQIMMDNLVYVALDGLAEPLREGLDSGAIPIGPLLESLWVQRKPLPGTLVDRLAENLWSEVGMPDAPATRAYTIATPAGNLFVIAETYRRGMRMNFDPPAVASDAASTAASAAAAILDAAANAPDADGAGSRHA